MPGILVDVPGSSEQPSSGPVVDAAVSVAGDDLSERRPSEKRLRRLPSVYLGNTVVFADRDQDRVRERVERSVSTMLSASTERPYLLQPCRLNGRTGLYWRDLYSRSLYRRRLARLGVGFSADPYPRLTERGAFVCEDWGDFFPDFAILGHDDEDDPEAVSGTSAGLLTFGAATGRFGRPRPGELAILARTFQDVVAVSSQRPESVVSHLRHAWRLRG